MVGFEVELVERVAVFVVGGPEADVDLVAIEGEPGDFAGWDADGEEQVGAGDFPADPGTDVGVPQFPRDGGVLGHLSIAGHRVSPSVR